MRHSFHGCIGGAEDDEEPPTLLKKRPIFCASEERLRGFEAEGASASLMSLPSIAPPSLPRLHPPQPQRPRRLRLRPRLVRSD